MSSCAAGKYYSCYDNGLFQTDWRYAEKQVRRGFIRKVFGLIAVQLAITVGVSYAFLSSPVMKTYVVTNQWVLWTTYLASIVLSVMFDISEPAHRDHATGLFYLFGITICDSIVIASVSATYATDVVLLAALLTAGVSFCLCVYALLTAHDFKTFGGFLLSMLFAWLGLGVWQAFFPFTKTSDMILTGFGALVFACYIVYDVQRLSVICPDEYVCAAVNVYTDILNLYLRVLKLLQDSKNDKKW